MANNPLRTPAWIFPLFKPFSQKHLLKRLLKYPKQKTDSHFLVTIRFYLPLFRWFWWWRRRGSNSLPLECHGRIRTLFRLLMSPQKRRIYAIFWHFVIWAPFWTFWNFVKFLICENIKMWHVFRALNIDQPTPKVKCINTPTRWLFMNKFIMS